MQTEEDYVEEQNDNAQTKLAEVDEDGDVVICGTIRCSVKDETGREDKESEKSEIERASRETIEKR